MYSCAAVFTNPKASHSIKQWVRGRAEGLRVAAAAPKPGRKKEKEREREREREGERERRERERERNTYCDGKTDRGDAQTDGDVEKYTGEV